MTCAMHLVVSDGIQPLPLSTLVLLQLPPQRLQLLLLMLPHPLVQALLLIDQELSTTIGGSQAAVSVLPPRLALRRSLSTLRIRFLREDCFFLTPSWAFLAPCWPGLPALLSPLPTKRGSLAI